MQDIIVENVDRECKTVLFRGSNWSLMMYNKKIISKTGYPTNVELKKCIKTYITIFKKS